MDNIPDEFDQLVSQQQGQKTEEWDAERLGKFTCSKFSTMMKRGRKKDDLFGDMCLSYIYEKVAEILTMQPHIATGQAIEWGNEFEAAAALRYEEETGDKITRIGFLSYNEFSGGSPDGLVLEDGMIEIKCPYNPANHAKSLITQTYYNADHDWQVQGNLMITNRDWCDYVTFDPRVVEEPLQYSCFRVRRDDEKIEAIKIRLQEVKEKLDSLVSQLKTESIG